VDFYSVSSLKQQSAGRYGAILGHTIPIPIQPITVLPLNAACLAEKQIPVFGLTQIHDLPHWS